MTPERTGPERTCIGCRGVAPAAELLRYVAVDGVLVADPRRRLPGRGAHLHREGDQAGARPRATCVAMARRRRAFGRALRVTDLDLTVLDTPAD